MVVVGFARTGDGHDHRQGAPPYLAVGARARVIPRVPDHVAVVHSEPAKKKHKNTHKKKQSQFGHAVGLHTNQNATAMTLGRAYHATSVGRYLLLLGVAQASDTSLYSGTPHKICPFLPIHLLTLF